MSIQLDVKYAIRLLMKAPGFSTLAIVLLAIATALSLYMLTFVNTLSYKALPFEKGEDIVVIDALSDGVMQNQGQLSLLDLAEIRASITGLEEFVLIQDGYATLSGRDSAKSFATSRTQAGIFQLTRTPPLLGRGFTESEVSSGGESIMVISHNVWQSNFGGTEDIIDQTVQIDGENTRIIGVMPRGYHFPYNSDFWLPLRINEDRIIRGDDSRAMAVARVATGVSISDVQIRAQAIMKRLAETYPETNERIGAFVSSLPMSSLGQGSTLFITAWITALLLVALAGVNVGNLLISRAQERRKETAIRLALGAPKLKLISQMMWESLIIVFLGAGAGMLLAAWGLEATNSIMTKFLDGQPLFWWRFGPDRFFWIVWGGMVLSMLLFAGLLPATRAVNNELETALRDGARSAGSQQGDKLSTWLVVFECLLSVIILIAAGVLVINTFIAVHANYGVDPTGIYTARVNLPARHYPESGQQLRFAEDLRRTLEENAGIDAVSIMSSFPATNAPRPSYEVEDFEHRDRNHLPLASLSSVLPGSMKLLGVELMEGRFFDSRDNAGGMRTVIISEAASKLHWPGSSALGGRIRIEEGAKPGEGNNWWTVVGVVRQTVHGQPFGNIESIRSFYVPFAQLPTRGFYLGFAFPGDIAEVMRIIDGAVVRLDQEVPVFQVQTYSERMDRNVAGVSFMSQQFLLFGLVAVLLASSGIYAVMSQSIAQCTQEIGIKRALGATDSLIFRDFFVTAGRRFMYGIIPGALLGGVVGWLMSTNFPVGNTILTLLVVLVPLLLTLIILLATWVPTRRALAMEPNEALRHD
jgi:putative ABC transport system permease protein